jgi:molybdopterin-dependent oxidoreductase alpha subunit
MQSRSGIQIVPNDKFTGLKTHSIPQKAAGMPAVTSSLKHIAREMGLWKGLKILSKINQTDGFDCPGCAWPEPQHRSKLGEYCENGAKAIAEEGTDALCTPEFFRQHSVQEISSWSDFEIGKSGRIEQPMLLEHNSNNYKPISWDAAFDLIAENLKSTLPHRAIFYTSGRTSNEAAFLYQLMVRTYGTNNLPDCSNMCHESSGMGLTETIGIGKGTVTLEDIYEAEVVLVIGQNPGTNHPRMMSALQKCKGNGGIILHINPMPEVGTTRFVNPQNPIEILMGGTKLADHFLQVKIGGDIALFKLIMKELMQLESEKPGSVIDHDFIQNSTVGYENFKSALEGFDTEKAFIDCGIEHDQIKAISKIIATKKRIVSCWAMGLTQHKHAVNNIREVVNLHLLLGAIGKKGAGLCPVRGHSNVQGDRTMGIYEKPKADFLDRLDKRFDFKSPREFGYDTVESIEAMEKGEVDVFIALGGNFISATPDSERTGKAMQNCKLTVQVSTKLNRSHVVTGDRALILPCLGRTEIDVQADGQQFVTVENSMGVVSMSRGTVNANSKHLKSEPAIICGIAGRLLGEGYPVKWSRLFENYDSIRNLIADVIPGFENFNSDVRKLGGFSLPNAPRQGKFTTPDYKAHFTVNPLPNLSIRRGHFVMMTIRSHDQYNTTIYGLDDRYRGILNERRVIFMNPSDLAELSLNDNNIVDIISDIDGTERIAKNFHVKAYSLPKGCCATYFPETNCLVPLESYAEKSKTPMSKFIEVSIRKHL